MTLQRVSSWSSHEFASDSISPKDDILTYLHSPPLAVESVPDIMAYWENRRADEPALAEMALDYISAPRECDFLILIIF
jgi:hypothetical protein